MDNAVSLVQAYLRLNGYFTVTEFPIVEAMPGGGHRAATDLDVLAFRFPHAGRLVAGERGKRDRIVGGVDPALKLEHDEADMLIGEVKEGRAELNRGARRPTVLRAALTRFGCCHPDDVEEVVQSLVHKGQGSTKQGHQIRLVAFGSTIENSHAACLAMRLDHVIDFTVSFLRDNWDVLRVLEFKDPALGFLATIVKSGSREIV